MMTSRTSKESQKMIYDCLRQHEARQRNTVRAPCVAEIMILDAGILLVVDTNREYFILFDKGVYTLKQSSPITDDGANIPYFHPEVGLLTNVLADTWAKIAATAVACLARNDDRVIEWEDEDGSLLVPHYYNPLLDHQSDPAQRDQLAVRLQIRELVDRFRVNGDQADVWMSKEPIRVQGMRDVHGRSIPDLPVVMMGTAWFCFVDLVPMANWAHTCLYVFFGEYGVVLVPARFPPDDAAYYELEQVGQ